MANVSNDVGEAGVAPRVEAGLSEGGIRTIETRHRLCVNRSLSTEQHSRESLT